MEAPKLQPCHRTGNCCRGRGVCTLTPEDTRDIAAFLGLSPLDFRLKYTHRSPRGPVLRTRRSDGSCVFLTEEADCRVQPVKPRQCRTWPLWERLYRDEAAFRRARRECGMIGHLTHAQFQAIYAASQARTR